MVLGSVWCWYRIIELGNMLFVSLLNTKATALTQQNLLHVHFEKSHVVSLKYKKNSNSIINEQTS